MQQPVASFVITTWFTSCASLRYFIFRFQFQTGGDLIDKLKAPVSAYHAVVLCGYDDTSGMLRIWNPWYQYYETIYSLSNYVPAENRNRTYTYTKTIYNWA